MKSFGLLLMRLILAAVFVYHGGDKLFGWFTKPAADAAAGAAKGAPPKTGMEKFAEGLEAMKVPQPKIAAYVSAWTELAGGILLGLGFLSRLVAIPMAFNMYVAAFTVHMAAFGLQNKGMEYALTLAVVLTALIFTGPGCLSIDGMLFRRGGEEEEIRTPIATPTPRGAKA